MKNKKYIIVLILSFYGSIYGQCWKSADVSYIGIKTDGSLWKSINYNPQIVSSDGWQSVNGYLAIKNDGSLWSIDPLYQIGTENDWQSGSVGDSFALAIKSNGTLWGWGNNSFGQLGNGTITNPSDTTPMMQIGNDNHWKSVSAGRDYTFAIKLDGTLWSWGRRLLSDNTYTNITIPMQISSDTNWLKVDADRSATLGMKTDGTIWIINNTNALIQIGTDTDWKDIANGDTEYGGPHGAYYIVTAYYALKNDGTLWVWERYGFGPPSFGFNTYYSVPTQIEISGNFKSIYAGDDKIIGIKNDGSLWTRTTYSLPLSDIGCPMLGNENFNAEHQALITQNPVISDLNINTSRSLEKVIVTDLFGKKIIEVNNPEVRINVEVLKSGIYILQAISEGKSYTEKFIKL